MMIRRSFFLFFNSIAGQLLLLLILALVLFSFSFFVSIHLLSRDRPLAPPIMLFTERQIGVAESLTLIPPDFRLKYIAEMDAKYPRVSYTYQAQGFSLPEGLNWKNRHIGGLDDFRDFYEKKERQKVSVSFARKIDIEDTEHQRISAFFLLPDQSVLITDSVIFFPSNPPNNNYNMLIIFTVLCMVILLVWTIYFLVRPIRRLAYVTDSIAKDNGTTPQRAEESGPTEMRIAAMALNKMQDRINNLIADRTHMLAAVGHDLRTPVTRMRLRAELMPEDEIRTALLKDINVMDGLLTRLLGYFRKGEVDEAPNTIELSSLVDSQVSEWSDAGYSVEFVPCDKAVILGHTNLLLRMIDNLIDNAVKYAESCELTLKINADKVSLLVIDHGPGIVDDDKQTLLLPFVRGDKARTMNDKGGFGIGLAIVQQTANQHNANLMLEDTPGGGLTVKITFPLNETMKPQQN